SSLRLREGVASLAVATTAPTATAAVVLATRANLATTEPSPLSEEWEAALRTALFDAASLEALASVAGTTSFGAALPKAGLASLERSANAGPAPARVWVALPAVLPVPLPAPALAARGAAFFTFASMTSLVVRQDRRLPITAEARQGSCASVPGADDEVGRPPAGQHALDV